MASAGSTAGVLAGALIFGQTFYTKAAYFAIRRPDYAPSPWDICAKLVRGNPHLRSQSD